MTAPINPHVHPDPRRIAGDTPPADARHSREGSVGSVDADDSGQVGLSAAVSVDVRSAVGAENQAAAVSAPEHVEAAAQLVSSLTAQLAADPSGARAAHTNLDGRAALTLLS